MREHAGEERAGPDFFSVLPSCIIFVHAMPSPTGNILLKGGTFPIMKGDRGAHENKVYGELGHQQRLSGINAVPLNSIFAGLQLGDTTCKSRALLFYITRPN
jgi:hypothetical protein